jgi:hypothetical protein
MAVAQTAKQQVHEVVIKALFSAFHNEEGQLNHLSLAQTARFRQQAKVLYVKLVQVAKLDLPPLIDHH